MVQLKYARLLLVVQPQCQHPNANPMGYGDGVTEKAKSLVKIKQEKAEKKLLRQRAKLEHSTLPEFIRLIDYMGVETLVTLAIHTTSNFFEELVNPARSRLPFDNKATTMH